MLYFPALAAVCLQSDQSFEPRYELGQRVAALERAFLAAPEDSPARARLAQAAELAVERFFRFDYRGAAQALDGAAVFSPELPEQSSPGDQLSGWVLTPSRRLYGSAQARLEVVAERWYGQDLASAADGDSQWRLVSVGAGTVWSQVAAGGSPGLRFEREFGAEEYGDMAMDLRFEQVGDPARGAVRRFWFSRVTDLEARLAALETGIADWPAPELVLELASLRDNLALLRELSEGPAGETDWPAARLLSEAEQQLAAAREGKPWFGPGQVGQFWLTLAGKGRGTRLRLLVPEPGGPENPQPLVIALHGAGGSENMWFDAYGAGLIVELCRQRGWYLAAPRLGLLGGGDVGGLVDGLAARYPIDRQRVFVIGHSMGAARGLSLALAEPAKLRALALLGGGQRVRQAQRLSSLPIFLAAGSRDFARSGVEALHNALLEAKHPTLEFEITAGVEHLLVVPATLSRVFLWLDRFREVAPESKR
jgi:predicted esterase